MPRRNLNQSYPHGRICGTPSTGVKGSLIPSTGTNGPGYLYRYLTLPADNDAEFSGYITSLPVGLTLVAQENSEFLASGADGVYIVPIELRRNGLALFSTTFNIVFGEVATTVNGIVADAIAAGQSTGVSAGGTIFAVAGNATADGSTAGVYQGVTLFATSGAALATGTLADILTASMAIDGIAGGAVAGGLAAGITQTISVVGITGNASGAGVTATITSGAGSGTTLTQADIDAIVAAIWAHPQASKLLTIANFLALK